MKKQLLLIDNYDSFTYNLVHYFESLNCDVIVKRNDAVTIEMVGKFQNIVLSPGAGIPDTAGLLKLIIETYAETKNILGICLGMQAIGEVFGGKLINLKEVYHGVTSKVAIVSENELLFEGLGNIISVGRYHSWVLESNLPAILEVTSFDENKQVMSIRHKTFNVRGVQYHPESILTPKGLLILKNWLTHFTT